MKKIAAAIALSVCATVAFATPGADKLRAESSNAFQEVHKEFATEGLEAIKTKQRACWFAEPGSRCLFREYTAMTLDSLDAKLYQRQQDPFFSHEAIRARAAAWLDKLVSSKLDQDAYHRSAMAVLLPYIIVTLLPNINPES